MLIRKPSLEPVPNKAASPLEVVLREECEAMAIFALGAGIAVPPELLSLFDPQFRPASNGFETLGQMHVTLSGLIGPATPRAITLIHQQNKRHPLLTAFGPVPLVRWLLFIAIGAVVVMLGTALSPMVDRNAMQQDLLEGHGMRLLLSEIFLISASAIGTSFAILFRVNRYLSEGTYDPRYSSTYFIQLVLGVISGVMLSQLLFHHIAAKENVTAFDQPLLALVGGFSSSLVYRILNRLLVAIESLFGDGAAASISADFAKARAKAATPTKLPERPTRTS